MKRTITTIFILLAILTPSAIYAQVGQVEFNYQLAPQTTDIPITNTATMSAGSKTYSASACTEVGAVDAKKKCESTTAPPFNPETGKQDIIDKFGITMTGFDNTHLEWAWKEFWKISQSNMIKNNLVKGTIITAVKERFSTQTGCRTVSLNAYTPEETFQVIMVHELGHIVHNCNIKEQISWSAYLTAHTVEGGVSWYANNAPACSGSTTEAEDYAEMTTYYLNPKSPTYSSACHTLQPNPFLGGGFPMHYNVAKTVYGILNTSNNTTPQL